MQPKSKKTPEQMAQLAELCQAEHAHVTAATHPQHCLSQLREDFHTLRREDFHILRSDM